MSADGALPFIVIEGIDGAGKTTLAARVAEQFAVAEYVPRKALPDPSCGVRGYLDAVADVLWRPGDRGLDHHLPRDFWVYLQRAWYAAYVETVLRPVIERGHVPVVDGWYYKLVAKLVVGGLDLPSVQAIFAGVPEPSLVLLLDVDARDVWNRGRTYNAAELGSHAAIYDDLGERSFVDYQTRTFDVLQSLAAERPQWYKLTLPGDRTVDWCAGRVLDCLGCPLPMGSR